MPQPTTTAAVTAAPESDLIPLQDILALHRALISARARLPNADAFLAEVLDILRNHLKADGGLIGLCDLSRQSFASIVTSGVVPAPAALSDPKARLLRNGRVGGFDAQGVALGWAEQVAAVSGLEALAAAALSLRDETLGLVCLFGCAGAERHDWQQEGLAAAALEIGLAVSHLRLRADVESRLRERNERWSALYEMAVSLTRDLDNIELLDEIVRRAIHLLHTRGGGLSLIDEVTGESSVWVAYDRGEPMPQMIGRRFAPGEGLLGRILRTGEPQLEPAYLFPPADAQSPPLRLSVMGAPLFAGASCIGMLAVGDDPESRRFSTDEMQTLVLLAQQAGALLERIRGHAQRELLTVHRERARLARELHDGLAQNLASLLLKAELCNDMARGANPELAEQIELLAEGIQQAVRETRAAISSLHEAPSDGESLMDALSLLAARFESQTGVPVALSWEGQAHREFPPATRVALLRVAQEALANVRKHACAQSVCAHLNASSPKTVELTVHDDGCGFDARSEALDGAQHFGLRGMRDRVEELGGSLRVDSTPGQGATVTAMLPLAATGRQ
ncbi:MAG: GAF domain-containing sensor histidine kinase [Anaerolineae bacterium]|jgi:signal transduction histidine kinase|nr:GAF domain-containing sensor histidine kinase [Anaerolineae bacterium]